MIFLANQEITIESQPIHPIQQVAGRTLKQLAGAHEALTEPMIRWWIFNAESNGFNTCMIRIGGRVVIDMTQLERWIDTQRVGTLPPGPNE